MKHLLRHCIRACPAAGSLYAQHKMSLASSGSKLSEVSDLSEAKFQTLTVLFRYICRVINHTPFSEAAYPKAFCALSVASLPLLTRNPVRNTCQTPCMSLSRLVLNSVPSVQFGNVSSVASLCPTVNSSCRSSTIPDRSQLGSYSSEGLW